MFKDVPHKAPGSFAICRVCSLGYCGFSVHTYFRPVQLLLRSNYLVEPFAVFVPVEVDMKGLGNFLGQRSRRSQDRKVIFGFP